MDAGATNQSTQFRAMSSAGPLTGKVASDFTLWYRRTGGAKTALTLLDLASLAAAHSDGGVFEIDDGWYRLDLPDAACAVGADFVLVGGAISGGAILSAPIPLLAGSVEITSTGEIIVSN